MSKKTAVDILYKFLYEMKSFNGFNPYSFNHKEIFEIAKEMENAQRQKDFKAGNDSACMEHENIEDYFKQYIKSK